jgi:hypothetical protein
VERERSELVKIFAVEASVTMIRNRAVLSGASGLPGLFTAYFEASSPPTVAEATEAAARVRAFWVSVAPTLWNVVSVVFTGNCDEIDPATGALTGSVVGTTPVTVTGSGGGQPLPLGTVLEAKYLSNVIIRGRRVQGRSFAGPFMQSDSVAGVPSGAIRTGVVTGAGKLGTTIATPIGHVVWSRPVKDPITHTITAPGASALVNSYDVSAIWSLLRSRRT